MIHGRRSANWYDFTVEGQEGFLRQFVGQMGMAAFPYRSVARLTELTNAGRRKISPVLQPNVNRRC
ncbi:MAG: DUF756 domain-containing protein [Alphaproteobacteria bacterium]|nr:DUF756 domain-containing protein [Alphaproteobacteria bacterium]